jgi:hypothetical protein
MRHAAAGCIFTFCLAVLSAGPAFTQTQSSQASSATPATTTAAQVAYVYVGTSKGVYLYDASANGALAPVSGSPFSIAGSAVGSNGKYFVSLGTDYVHSYSIASNGAIKGQVSQINTQTYFSEPNSDCGGTAGAEFDHSGKDIYVLLGLNGCSTLQSYQISSAGALSFLDSSSFEGGTVSPYTFPPAITADDQYGYSGRYVGFCTEDTEVFQRQSSGAMQYLLRSCRLSQRSRDELSHRPAGLWVSSHACSGCRPS